MIVFAPIGWRNGRHLGRHNRIPRVADKPQANNARLSGKVARMGKRACRPNALAFQSFRLDARKTVVLSAVGQKRTSASGMSANDPKQTLCSLALLAMLSC
jgi:hypothetical protein